MSSSTDTSQRPPFKSSTSSALAATQFSRRPLDVLVIEDEPSMRRAMELTLGHLGHLVFSAPSLVDAMKLMEGFAIDLIICDYVLPDGRGTDLITRWPRDLRRVPSVAVSGSREPDLRRICLAAGFDAFLEKPLNLEELLGVMRKLVGDDDSTAE